MSRAAFFTFALILAALAPPVGATEQVGDVLKVQADSFQAAGFVGQALEAEDPIFRDARVYTKNYGTVQIVLNDGSDVMISPNSSIVIDEFVYAGGDGDGMGLRLLKGALRVISGRMPSSGYQVETEVAAIGVRGTRYWLDVDEPGILKIWVDEGAVAARPVLGDREFVFSAPVYAECTPTTCEITPAPPQPSKFPLDPRGR